MDALTTFVEGPSAWPLWARRGFVLTLPVSGPLWFLLTLALVMLTILCIAPAMALRSAYRWARDLWRQS